MARATKLLPNGAKATSPDERAAMLEHVTKGAEARPGVYRMLSADGGVIYVGKSARVRERLLSYFRAERREKPSRILREARAIDWSYEPNELAALREELRLIKLYRPRFNVMGKHDREHYAFLRITPGPAPRLEVARRDAAGEGQYYGPFIGPSLVRDAAQRLSDALGLRDCKDSVTLHFRRENQPIPLGLRAPDCIRHDVGKCVGPCVAACDRAEYAGRVALAKAFLEGESKLPVERFRREMEEAKRELAYERAALFRDRLARLEQLRAQFGKLRFALESLSFVYPMPGHGGDDRVYLVRRGTVRAELPAPRTTEERLHLQRMIEGVFAPREPQTVALRNHEVEEILLLSAWFRARPAELARAWRPDLM